MTIGLHILGAVIIVLLAIGGGFLGQWVFRRRLLDRQTAERLGRIAARSLREGTKRL